MARRRVIDWKKVEAFLKRKTHPLKSRKGKPAAWPVKLTWFAILAGVDDFGQAGFSPAQIATRFMEEELDAGEITVAEVAAIMERFALGKDPSLLTWEYEGQRYYSLPKSQDYQRVHNASNPDCPFPPEDIFAKLSRKTRDLFRKFLAKFTSFAGGQFRPEVEGEVEGEVEVEVERDSQKSRGCSWCLNPTDPNGDNPEPQRLAQIYHDAYREAHDDCPSIAKAEFGAIGKKLEEGKPFDRIAAVIRHGVRSQDPFVIQRGHVLTELCRNFQGIAQALDEGRAHGEKQIANAAPARRHAPTDTSQFRETGRVKL